MEHEVAASRRRAKRLAELQEYGVERTAAAGLSGEDVQKVVRRALASRD